MLGMVWFRWSLTVLAVVVTGVGGTKVGCGPVPLPDPLPVPPDSKTVAQKFYDARCAGCHGDASFLYGRAGQITRDLDLMSAQMSNIRLTNLQVALLQALADAQSPPAPLQYQLTTSVIGGNGTLTPASGLQNANAVVALAATPAAGYQVQKWTGTDNDASTANTNAVTMTGAKTVSVQFAAIPPVQYQLSTSVVGGNGTLAPASGPRNAGTVVTLTATPAAGYQVQKWTGSDNDASTATTNTVTMNAARTVTVQFQVIPPVQYQLTTSVIGGNGTLTPASGPQNAGTVVTLTATPAAGYQVQAWVGTNNDASKANTNTVTMTAAKTVTVQFQVIPPTGNAAAGQTLYIQSCQMCHGPGSFLHNRGNRIVTNLGSISPAMSFITLTAQQVLDLQAFAATQ
jgi:mono/diheme cytochrome c family protein